MKRTVGLVYDLRDDYIAEGYTLEQAAEFDSVETINYLVEAIEQNGYVVDRIGNGKALAGRLVAGCRWDMVFNVAEGIGGRCRESHVPALLEMYGVDYTFADPLACALTLDKAMAKEYVAMANLATPKFIVVESVEQAAMVNLCFPLFAKPLAEGTGKGIDQNSRIDTPEQLVAVCRDLLAKYNQPVLVEEYLSGREFTVGVLGNGPTSRVLGTMEIEVLAKDDHAIYSYLNKEECESRIRYSRLDDSETLLKARVEQLALLCYQVLGCRDSGRVDIRCNGQGEPCFIEVNPLAGLHPYHSDLPMIATNEGLAYYDLIGEILSNAFSRKQQKGKSVCRLS